MSQSDRGDTHERTYPPHMDDDVSARQIARGRARFESRYVRGAPDECWEWQGKRIPKGYGCSTGLAIAPNAHTTAWRLANDLRAIPKGMVIRHLCDNPPCVNPAHLRLGTYAENEADKKRHAVAGNKFSNDLSESGVIGEHRNPVNTGDDDPA